MVGDRSVTETEILNLDKRVRNARLYLGLRVNYSVEEMSKIVGQPYEQIERELRNALDLLDFAQEKWPNTKAD